MLVLSRKRNERIFIGNDVEVTVVAVSGGKVKLGFCAPAEIPIQREEVRDSIAAEDNMIESSFHHPLSTVADSGRAVS